MKKNTTIIREACVDSLENAVKAEACGAERIELCSHLEADGLTPGESLLDQVMKKLSIPVHAMARPRAGNFVYSPQETALILRDIDMLKSKGVAGVVIGMLDGAGNIDIATTKQVAAYAAPLKVTFHKAIDETSDILEALRQLLRIPEITGILTSGGKPTAIEGAGTLREMVEIAGEKIEIIGAGKITLENLDWLHQQIGARAYHGKKIVYG